MAGRMAFILISLIDVRLSLWLHSYEQAIPLKVCFEEQAASSLKYK